MSSYNCKPSPEDVAAGKDGNRLGKNMVLNIFTCLTASRHITTAIQNNAVANCPHRMEILHSKLLA